MFIFSSSSTAILISTESHRLGSTQVFAEDAAAASHVRGRHQSAGGTDKTTGGSSRGASMATMVPHSDQSDSTSHRCIICEAGADLRAPRTPNTPVRTEYEYGTIKFSRFRISCVHAL